MVVLCCIALCCAAVRGVACEGGPAVSLVFEGVQGQLKGRDLRGGVGGAGGGF